jgi:DNA invertase Pin-like site-specific DNA recombinase
MRCAIYARISMDKTGDELGVQRQVAACRDLARQRGWTVAREYIDNDRSAYSRKPRPEFEALMADVQLGTLDRIIVWRTDRFYRRVADLERIVPMVERAGVSVEAVMSGQVNLATADGRMMARIMGSVAEHESDVKGERVRARVQQRLHQEGRQPAARRPFGWAWIDPDPKDPNRPVPGSRAGLKPHPVEAALVAEMYARFIAGENLSQIARWLTESGATGSSGGRITQSRVSFILRNPRHAGLLADIDPDTRRVRGVLGEASDGQRIVAPDVWRSANAVLTDPGRRRKPGRPAVALLSGGLAVCPVCGGKVVAGSNAGRNGERFPSYDCQSTRHVSRKRDIIDALVIAEVGSYLQDNRAQLVAAAERLQSSAGHSDAGTTAEAEALRARQQELADLVTSGDLAPTDYAQAVSGITARLQALPVAAPRPPRALLELLRHGDIAAAWQRVAADDIPQARIILGALIDRVEVLPRRAGVRIVWKTAA